MTIWILLETGLREIAAHKFRSFLSMLGIVLGVASLIATMSLTNGIERGARAFMQQIGGLELVQIIQKEVSADKIDLANLSPGRTLLDAYAIRSSVPLITHISPEITVGAAVSSGPKTIRLGVTGTWPDHFVVGRHELAYGRLLSNLDVDRSARVVVIGSEVVRRLWPEALPQDAVGQVITINQTPFKVVGVLVRYEREEDKRFRTVLQARNKDGKVQKPAAAAAGRWDAFRRKNESIIVPLTTLFYEFKSGTLPDDSIDSVRLDNVSLRVGNLDQFQTALEQVRSTLNTTHRGVDDYDLQTREEWFDRMAASISATRMSGGLIAGISLIVGGIGITNIMLASITERVREIGIRMAVGARGRDIFFQILIESVSVALIGGVLGIAAGFGLINLLIVVAPGENVPFMTMDSVVISVIFALVAGIVSGIYPALKASQLDPINALRYE